MPNPAPADDEFVLVDIDEPPSDDTLERAPDRVLSMLRGIANNPVANAILSANGYDNHTHAEGWSLLQASGQLGLLSTAVQQNRDTADAIAALDRWDNENFAIIASALQRKFPLQRRALFHELAPGEGAASVLAVETLLARLAQLAAGKLTDDKSADKDASELLEKRGYTLAARKLLGEQLAAAKALPTPVFESREDLDARAESRRAALLELHGWWHEWATVARKKIKRRDLLINLGLAERKRPEKNATEGEK